MPPKTLVVGLGSPHGDDAIGWQIVDRLRSAVPCDAEIRVAADPTEILGWLEGVTELHVCDACQSRGRPGQVHRWRWPEFDEQSPTGRLSSHGTTLHEVLRLGERLGLLPPRVMIWGIEIAEARPAKDFSASLEQVMISIVPRIAGEIRHA